MKHSLALALLAITLGAQSITEPVTVAQYDDSVVVYLHGFDLYQDLSLECRLLAADTVADTRTMTLNEQWETPAITMRTGASSFSGVVQCHRYFRRPDLPLHRR